MTDLWAGDFGDEYTKRNMSARLDARESVWKVILPRECESVLEVGANVGLNLEAIGSFTGCDLYACEPNDLARMELERNMAWLEVPKRHITADYADKLSFEDNTADLVFTCGVLIHIPPDKLLASMKEMHRCSRRYIICGEYFAPSEEMIPYRGHDNALWRRDYGSLFMDNFPDLHCLATMFAWKRQTGMDNLVFWAFEKGAARH